MSDLISRQAAIDALFWLYEYQRDIDPTEAADLVRQGIYLAEKKIEQLPSAQPEITEEDVREWCYKRCLTIIDNALYLEMRSRWLPSAQPDISEYSDKLWRNAYERGKRDAQPETIRCKDCKYWNPYYAECEGIGNWFGFEGAWSENGYCYKAEGREE